MYFSCLCLSGLCACVLPVYGVIKNSSNNNNIFSSTEVRTQPMGERGTFGGVPTLASIISELAGTSELGRTIQLN